MIHTYSTQKCGRWDFCFFCIIPVKSTDSGFSIDTILPKWGKNGANIKITTLNESLNYDIIIEEKSLSFPSISPYTYAESSPISAIKEGYTLLGVTNINTGYGQTIGSYVVLNNNVYVRSYNISNSTVSQTGGICNFIWLKNDFN